MRQECRHHREHPGRGSSLEGGWTLVGLEKDGKKIAEEDVAKLPAEVRKIRATGDKLIATKGGKDDPLSYKLDGTKSPGEIDMTETGDDGKPKKSLGIYKLEGGVLTICAVESDKPADRPKEFKSTAENKAMIMVLKKD